MGKTATEAIAVMTAVLGRLTPQMRGSVTFDEPRQEASGSSPEGTEVRRSRRDITLPRTSRLAVSVFRTRAVRPRASRRCSAVTPPTSLDAVVSSSMIWRTAARAVMASRLTVCAAAS